jgi:hypothetical protein
LLLPLPVPLLLPLLLPFPELRPGAAAAAAALPRLPCRTTGERSNWRQLAGSSKVQTDVEVV